MSVPTASTAPRRSSFAGRYEIAYRGLILFTILLYLRPNELLPIGTFPVVKILTIGTLAIFFLDKLGQGGSLSIMPHPFKYLLIIDALAVVSIPMGLDPAASFDAFTDLFLKILLIFLLMINVVTSFRRLRFIIEVTVASAAIVALMTLADFVQGRNLVEYYRASGALGGIFGNPNDLALSMNMLIPFAVYLGITRPNPLMRFMYFVCAILLGATSVATYSRAGFLSMAIAGTFFLVKISRRYPAALVVGVLGALGLAVSSPGRIFTLFGEGGSNLTAAESASARWELIKRSFEAAGFNPFRWLFGVGLNNFHIVSNKELVNHNAYLQVFNEIGLPALCFYVLFLASVVAISARIVKRYRQARGYRQVWLMAVAIQTSLIVYLIGSFFASVAYLWYVYYPAAFAVCLQQFLREAERSPQQKGVAPRVWYLRRVQH
ncbi:MAG TPA: O-antigen ligase family protein [Methylomirabilota bacterium]|nr:O-antigen ligase family protein [Methylomirabilota bacterium]